LKTIGLLSDTHSDISDKILDFFSNVNEIWHAGDIGSMDVVNQLQAIKPLKAVYGNIDDYKIRQEFPEIMEFMCESIAVLMIHIGGYPGKYEKKVIDILKTKSFDLFISGHSHILKVIYDKKYEMMHINPGAAGKNGFHNVRTAVKFNIDGKELKNLQIFEMDR
jgi:putative phosphoesterase